MQQQLSDLALRRRVRDRINREYAQPLDVVALARGAHTVTGQAIVTEARADGEAGGVCEVACSVDARWLLGAGCSL